ncbi:Flp family type IVb pilin [Roseiarcaceae bacterium H3SJ34-1]|uniref:Flp family type IVb pilin n=1 Tax=Terripilifer ovatus TaxID=3032367 RepID=UPI003AB93EAD|nr:Flp family type IVb pilin [Roseiarcaceae bacterium H3SJ34-1]
MARICKFLADQRGATSIEYGFIGVTVSIAIVAGVTSIGSKLKDQWYVGLANGFK